MVSEQARGTVVSVPSPFPFSRLHSGGKGSGEWPMVDASERYAIIALLRAIRDVIDDGIMRHV